MISQQTEKPLACWKGRERHGSAVIDCLTVIFRTGGCSWARCRMCSYHHERYDPQSCSRLLEHLQSQLAWVLEAHPADSYRMVKIFTSGSFFDPGEVPVEFHTDILGKFSGKILIIESRPEYIQKDVLGPFAASSGSTRDHPAVYVAMGLETSSDAIREKCINKGFAFAEYTRAAAAAHAAGAGVKTYLLFKPLFLTESEAVADMRQSFSDIRGHTDLVSMNPCTVQRRTELEHYWRTGAYRPPYLWSVLSLLRQSPVHITCDPLGGGQQRGPHNCGSCDYEIVKGIRDYSLTADRELLDALMETDCACKAEWEYVLEHEQPWCMPLT